MVPEMNREFPPVFDGHEDFITQVKARRPSVYPPGPREPRDFLAESGEGHVDLPRAMRGGLGGCFTSIFLTDERAEMNALAYAIDEMNDVFALADRSEGRFRVCRTVAEVRSAFDDGAFASVFMFEGADPISWSLKELRVFYEAGLRVLAPTWSRSTIFAHGVAFSGSLPETGLTDAGRRLVHECNRLGILLDVSHINPAGFRDMLEESSQPVIATHSSMKAISPHVRNLDDDQVRALAAKGGAIGINFANYFLRPDMQGGADVPVEVVLQHFDHVINLAGDEHVAFGTDFDGAPVPEFVKDAAGLPEVLRAMKRHGYSDDRLERICNGNFLRVAEAASRPPPA
ncbi:MAG: dipeptidase [Chloroflexota bacterium]